jgi:hypothetical protein
LEPVTAQPQDDHDPDDPVEILQVLPGQYHTQFRAEYEAAEAARRPEHYRELHCLLRLWRLRSLMYSQPGYAAAKETARTGAGTWVPVEDVVPGWTGRAEAARRRHLAG